MFKYFTGHKNVSLLLTDGDMQRAVIVHKYWKSECFILQNGFHCHLSALKITYLLVWVCFVFSWISSTKPSNRWINEDINRWDGERQEGDGGGDGGRERRKVRCGWGKEEWNKTGRSREGGEEGWGGVDSVKSWRKGKGNLNFAIWFGGRSGRKPLELWFDQTRVPRLNLLFKSLLYYITINLTCCKLWGKLLGKVRKQGSLCMLIEVEMPRKSLELITSFKLFALFFNTVTSWFDLVLDLVT